MEDVGSIGASVPGMHGIGGGSGEQVCLGCVGRVGIPSWRLDD